MKWLLTALLVLAAPAVAACPSDRICLAWVGPTQNVDGSPVRPPITYRVYRVGAPLDVLVGSTPLLSMAVTQQPSGWQCFFVTAVTIDGESAPSMQGCKFLRPSAPTDGAIEAPSDGAIEDRR